ncbi:MAG: flagellar basal body P-ring formation chaperone FlgA [Gammaproteobacteria bacterium]|jgi:flagella basal body P-ring formation protein FlgA
MMLAVCAGGVQAGELESHARIGATARQYALDQARQALPEARLHVEASPLDTRLSLARCGAELEAFRANSMPAVGNTVVGVRCTAPKPWTVYVPVTVDARIRILVVGRTLPRAATLQTSDVRLVSRNVARLPYGYYTDAAQVAGQVLTRQVLADQVLTPTMLRRPLLVHRGQTVSIVSGLAGVSVSTQGVALGDAPRNGRVKVRNTRSRRVVEGVVIAPGQVQVQG